MPLVQALQFYHMTAAYSNAVLVAVLPHISDFAQKLDLPIPLPITRTNVVEYKVNPIVRDFIGCSVFLDSHKQLAFDDGYVMVYNDLTNNPYNEDDPANSWRKFAGKDNMTTNEAIELARNIMVKLGYSPKELHADGPPFSFEPPANLKTGEHIPYCNIWWDDDDAGVYTNINESVDMNFQIDMERKQLVGMSLVSRKFWNTNPPVPVIPELESDYLKRIRPRIFTNTNAPKRFQPPAFLPSAITNRSISSSSNSPPTE